MLRRDAAVYDIRRLRFFMNYKMIPNMITSVRLFGAIILLFVPPMTAPFFAVYTICGLTDACDGFIARKLDAVTDFGSKLDSVSDITFYIVMISRVLPEYYSVLPHSYWYAVAAVLVVRLASYAVSAIKQHRFASVHTLLNKVTGAGVFFAPYLVNCSFFTVYAIGVCSVAALASTEELIMHIIGINDSLGLWDTRNR
jgi:phosphatidylglycerophosphate synthase